MFLLVIAFFALRLPGVHLPYHQDEWKNVSASATVQSAGQFFAHPPFMQMFFVADYKIFGPDYFRLLPLLFSCAAGILLYYVVKRRAGERAAWWAAGLFVVCFYNIIGSLQTDVDGSILPFFFLLAVWVYDRHAAEAVPQARRRWLAALVLVLLAGLLIKLSFILVVGALIIDHLWIYRRDAVVKRITLAAGGSLGFGVIYIAALYLIQALYPAFDIHFMIGHANQFAGAGGRNWTQIFVQGVKALYYLSPLLVVPLIFVSKEIIRKTRVFGLYLVLGFVFYFILFDFSQAALDKYLAFAIVPLVVIAGVILREVFVGSETIPKKSIAGGVIISAILVALNFVHQIVAALYPKSEWFGRVLHGHWNVLTPLTGGSGPLGFYVSFLFIAVSFIVATALAITGIFKKTWRTPITISILCIGLAYNAVFAEELLFGHINGDAPQVLSETISYIAAHPEIKQVLTYNDTGSGPLSALGVYAGRIYAVPAYEDTYRQKFKEFTGQYMVIDIPHIYEGGFYGKFFAGCTTLFEAVSGKITGRVYECSAVRSKIDSL